MGRYHLLMQIIDSRRSGIAPESEVASRFNGACSPFVWTLTQAREVRLLREVYWVSKAIQDPEQVHWS